LEEGGQGKRESGLGSYIVVVLAREMAEEDYEVGPGQRYWYLALWLQVITLDLLDPLFQIGVCICRTLDLEGK